MLLSCIGRVTCFPFRLSVIVTESVVDCWTPCTPLVTCPARMFTRCIQRRTEQNFRTDMNTSIIQGRGIVRFGNPLFPIVRWMDSPASNRLSNRINAHLSSSKLRSPDKMPRAISRFITHYPWSVNHEPGSTHIVMSNVVDARSINVSWNIADSFPANFIRVRILQVTFPSHHTLRPRSHSIYQSKINSHRKAWYSAAQPGVVGVTDTS